MIAATLALLAVLVPGLPIEAQPHLPEPRVTTRELVTELRHQVRTEPDPHPCATEPDVPDDYVVSCHGDGWVILPPAVVIEAVPEPWASLADCESGDWLDGGAAFVTGSARWRWGAPGTEVPPWGTELHHGGLQHHPDTWRWIAGDLGLLDRYPHAYDAPPHTQVEVAREVQRRQGWAAWPVCSQKVGLR